MKFWNKLFSEKKLQVEKEQEEEQLLADLERAKEEWDAARIRLDQVTGKDEIDYAIYAHEAAQKRYELLLRYVRSARQYPIHDEEDYPNQFSQHSSDIEKSSSNKDMQSYELTEERAEQDQAGKDETEQETEAKKSTESTNQFKLKSSKFRLMVDLKGKTQVEGEG